MRVALFTETFLPKVDGIVNTLCHLLEHLAARGHESILFAPDGGPAQFAQTRVYGLPSMPLPFYPELRLVPPLISVMNQLRAFQPDLVHVINPVSLGIVGLEHGRRLKVPVVASYHTDVPGFAARWGLGILYHPLMQFFRWLHNYADLNLCPSLPTLRELQRYGYKRLNVWGRGVDSSLFHPGKRSLDWRRGVSNNESEKPLLLYVGRLSPEKRVDWLLPVLDSLPEARLVIVGDGPTRPRLERMFSGRAVHFTGYLRGEQLAQAYASCDIFVFPAANETLGNVVLEAMASGLPVVAPRSGGVQDHVVPDTTGLLFDPGAQRELVSAVAQLIHQPLQAQLLGANGRRAIEARSWALVLDDLFVQYARVLNSRTAGQLLERPFAA
ncbi:MAG: glycosyltransferase family 1 protein [Caldilineaceae bacterium]